MLIKTITTCKLTPSDEFQLHRISTNEIFDGFIFIPNSVNIEDFDEIKVQEPQDETIEEL